MAGSSGVRRAERVDAERWGPAGARRMKHEVAVGGVVGCWCVRQGVDVEGSFEVAGELRSLIELSSDWEFPPSRDSR